MTTPARPLILEWDGERRFRGGHEHGPRMTIDCTREAAPGPVDALLLALASCAAVDVLAILQKRRTPAASLQVEVEHMRADTPPRRLTAVVLRFVVTTASERHHVEHAVELATTRYCSVAASLAPDIPITHDVIVNPPDAAEAV